jgi:hypothetical protein
MTPDEVEVAAKFAELGIGAEVRRSGGYYEIDLGTVRRLDVKRAPRFLPNPPAPSRGAQRQRGTTRAQRPRARGRPQRARAPGDPDEPDDLDQPGAAGPVGVPAEAVA